MIPKLTFNLGLRYELESGLKEASGQFVTGFDTTTPSPLRAGAVTNFNANVPTNVPLATFQNLAGGLRFAENGNDVNQGSDKNNFQPRFGFSYAINDKTVIRGGFGIFTSPFQIQPINQSGFTASDNFHAVNQQRLNFSGKYQQSVSERLESGNRFESRFKYFGRHDHRHDQRDRTDRDHAEHLRPEKRELQPVCRRHSA